MAEVFKGTQITGGHGKDLVVATGMKTGLGHIAGMPDKKDSDTSPQNRLGRFSRNPMLVPLS